MNAPWKTGLALALSMAISYTVCALLYAMWPAQGIAFDTAITVAATTGLADADTGAPGRGRTE